ncbi:MAG: radical SAM protein [Elusimicrobiota bacterium]
MPSLKRGIPPWNDLRRLLAGALAQSKIDMTDEVMVLGVFMGDLGSCEIYTADKIKKQWGMVLDRGSSKRGRSLKLEIVFPFCAQKCLYCLLGTRVASGSAELKSYLDDILSEAGFLAPAFSGCTFSSFWIGRGTPSLLTISQMNGLMSKLRGLFNWDERGLVGIECDPAGVDEGKIRALREMGFNHISFGVESWDRRILKMMGRRRQNELQIRHAVAWARKAGFDDVNLDLVFGLGDESVDSFLGGFQSVAALRPETITICSLSPTQAYLKKMGVSRESNMKRMEGMLPDALNGLHKRARACGYSGTLRPEEGVWRLVSSDASQLQLQKWAYSENGGSGMTSSRLALGFRARSQIFRRLVYQRAQKSFSNSGPIYKARPLNGREAAALYILECLNLRSRVNSSEFAEAFGQEIDEIFSEEIGLLSRLKKISLDRKGFSFLPVRQTERIFYAAVFLWDVLAERSLNPI